MQNIVETIIVLASVAAQIGMMMLLDNYRDIPHGEGRGFTGMFLLQLTFISLLFVIPGAFASFVRVILLVVRLIRLKEDDLTQMVCISINISLNIVNVLIPLVFLCFIQSADKPRDPENRTPTIIELINDGKTFVKQHVSR